jgi:ferredoxin
LSAAFYLRQQGHACTVFDEHAEPGGMLRYGVPEAKLPRAVLDGEIDLLRRLGVEFRTSIVVGKDISMADVEKSFDAVVLAIGGVEAVGAARFGVTMTERGIQVETSSFQTSRRGCFAGGDAIQPTRLAVRATGHGKAIAAAVSQFLNGEPVKGLRSRFNCRVGRLKNGEMEEYLKEADRSPRQEPHEGGGGFSREEAVREAGRCLHCDCRKADACRLRDHAEAYGATQLRYAADDRRLHESAPPPIESSERVNVRRILDHADVVFEPGKCVRCGLCVQVTEKAGEKLGLTFLGRGFGAQIGIPFNEPLDRALEKAATECIDACPTGALAHRNEEMK